MKQLAMVCVFVLIPFFVRAGCEDFPDETQKNLCFASVTKDMSYCEKIPDNDTKYYCLARLSKDKAYCKQMISKKSRRNCLKGFKK